MGCGPSQDGYRGVTIPYTLPEPLEGTGDYVKARRRQQSYPASTRRRPLKEKRLSDAKGISKSAHNGISASVFRQLVMQTECKTWRLSQCCYDYY